MKYLFLFCVLISSLSFLAYSISYFVSPNMKKEFIRFNLEKSGLSIIVLEILGALGLLIGLLFKPLLLLSSAGLTLLMFAGIVVRIRSKDGLLVSFPAIFYMILNAFIFFEGIKD